MTRAEKVRKHCEQFDVREEGGVPVMVASFDENDANEVERAAIEVAAMCRINSEQEIRLKAGQLDALLDQMTGE